MHPSGLPRLVGPEGSPFPHTDYSHSFRYLPNNVTDELPPKILDSLPISRANTHPLKVRASPSSPRGTATSHPLRLRTEHPKPGSPHEHLPSSPSHHLLGSGTTTIAALPNLNAQQPAPLAITPSDISISAAETLESPAVVTAKSFISTSEEWHTVVVFRWSNFVQILFYWIYSSWNHRQCSGKEFTEGTCSRICNIVHMLKCSQVWKMLSMKLASLQHIVLLLLITFVQNKTSKFCPRVNGSVFFKNSLV